MDDVSADALSASRIRSPIAAPIAFDNSYARLPDRFFVRLAPSPVHAPSLVRLNAALARGLGLDPEWLASPDGVEVLAGNRIPPGAEPVAMAYAGHQFGNWVPRLGDGRAILLGEVIDTEGVRRDIHLKGAGRTPFSRSGDGRAALGPMLREYIISEAMAALGVPTTRSLAVVATGEPVMRDSVLPGAILARVAQSHVRIGTFEYFGNQGDLDAVRVLADYVIDRHYPEARTAPRPYRFLLDAVIGRTARLIAQWQMIGFIHGVMNTDNLSIAGETIDYGPCAFMDAFDPATVYSSIDVHGRYAFGNQPRIANWNLVHLAQALLPLLHDDPDAAIASGQEALNAFPARFEAAYLAGLRAKLGLAAEQDGDAELAGDLLACMAANKADFTLTFRGLGDAIESGTEGDRSVRALFEDPASFDEWSAGWRSRLAREARTPSDIRAAMRSVNPAFIPRNHRVEAALAAAQASMDLGPLDELLTVLSSPYDDHPDLARYGLPPKPEEVVKATFCGT